MNSNVKYMFNSDKSFNCRKYYNYEIIGYLRLWYFLNIRLFSYLHLHEVCTGAMAHLVMHLPCKQRPLQPVAQILPATPYDLTDKALQQLKRKS